ncbi:hypothetical protein SLE2022_324360 [Rubroshorea leprosula]
MKMLSNKISSNCHWENSSYFLGLNASEKDRYHKFLNPSGIIQMCLAENQVSLDLVESWIEKNLDAVRLRKDGASLFRELALFEDYHGLHALKTALAGYMEEIRGSKAKFFDPHKLVLTAGATAANETLIFCLANPGEAILIPTPYYPGYDRDLQWRTEVKIVPIHCSSLNDFRITMSALEAAYEDAQKLNLKVKAVLVTNPSNPLGRTLIQEELNNLISFAIDKEIHIINDEVFSGTVFDSPGFTSVMEAASNRNLQGCSVWSRIHIVYSLSKHLGLSGFRVGMIYSNNEAIVSAATKMSSFGLVSSQTQFLLSNMLVDKKFTAKYIKENQKRLKKRKEMFVSELKKAGIECFRGNAGLFCWVDMRNFLSSSTFEAEEELQKKMLYSARLNVSPGSSCHCSEPGWFRVCFANMPEEALRVAIQRFKIFAELSTAAAGGNSRQSLPHVKRKLSIVK